jgi:lysyl-tRNA synthetase class 2
MRRRPELALSWAAALVGLISIASSLTPELASRVDVVSGVLPPGVPGAARLVALAFGIALVLLARSLARRRRRAWQLSLLLVAGVSLAHIAKGLDVEEATFGLLLQLALIRYHKRFDVPGDPAAWRPLAATGSALAAGGAVTAFFATRGPLPDGAENVIGAIALLLGLRAIQLWLRPLSERVRQSVEERRVARGLVAAYGRDSLSYFSLRRDKSWFFSPSRRSFLAYRVVAGIALVSGDPIGDDEELDELLGEFRRVAHASGWRIAIIGAGGPQAARYRRLGLRAIKVGDEAVLRPQSFSLQGRPIRKVRQSATRLTKAGYRVRILSPAEVGPPLRAQLDAVTEEWRGSQPERGFSMAMDDLYADPDILFAVAEDADGRVGGFLHLVPAPAGGGWSLSAMRRRRGTPNGLMEFLIVETAAWARDHDVAELSLNFCAFRDQLEDGAPWFTRAALLRCDRLFQLERLHAFSRKFFPEWRPRYLCLESYADLPLVGLAYLHVESLLVPPGPWARRRETV